MNRLLCLVFSLFLLAGCGRAAPVVQDPPAESGGPPAASEEPAPPAAEADLDAALNGRALGQAGFGIALPEDTGLSPPDGGSWTGYCQIVERDVREGFEADLTGLRGTYNEISVLAPDYLSSASLPVSYLQVFTKEDLASPDALIAVDGGLRLPEDLKGCLLWEDEEFAVYDFGPLLVTERFSDRVKAHRKAVEDLLTDPEGIEERKSIGHYDPENEQRIIGWDYSWLQNVADILQLHLHDWIVREA